ncbi:hypothetical protein AB0J72_48175 [Dactylosporangium sp. NPDC049742]|uniref:hypothetical protein n=1 Tax=Dactylosporangium sp. NPDC049742 TaxID=3154737 RepID=UPI0034306161
MSRAPAAHSSRRPRAAPAPASRNHFASWNGTASIDGNGNRVRATTGTRSTNLVYDQAGPTRSVTFAMVEDKMAEGYTDFVMEVDFITIDGTEFTADFVARKPGGRWVAFEAKGNAGKLRPAQTIGYSQLDYFGAEIRTARSMVWPRGTSSRWMSSRNDGGARYARLEGRGGGPDGCGARRAWLAAVG